MVDSYPRLAARTLRFTLGLPRNITVSPDGRFVRFIRTPDGVTRTGHLWEYDVQRGTELELVDPSTLVRDDDLPEQERRRRERSRESAAGLVAYDVDDTGRWACFTLSGRLFATHLAMRATHELSTGGPVVDPHLDPTGRHIAYACGGALRVIDVSGENDRELVAEDGAVWGQAEFIAAEELDRFRGFWWSPDGTALLVERYDESPVPMWHIADPANPQNQPVAQRYPAAGTANADVSLWHVDLADGRRTRVDLQGLEYLARVSWTRWGPPVVQALSRDQRRSLVLQVADDGSTEVLAELADDAWVDVGPTPQYAPGGRLVTGESLAESCQRVPGTFLRTVEAVFEDSALVTLWTDPTSIQVARIATDGSIDLLTQGDGVHGVAIGGPTTVIVRSTLDSTATGFLVHRPDGAVGRLRVVSEPAPFHPAPELLRLGDRGLSAAVLFPRAQHDGPLPILMDPYGGPHAQRVLASARMFLEPQWLADQGFCVVVADGRGTPGRGPAWEREILHDFAGVTLQDQVDAVQAVCDRYGERVDPSRVAISGWSYGGYLSALAVLKRPDVFHAAVAGAPVTEWRLYDTCYTERYLGHPDQQPQVYDANSLLPLAPDLQRPLMLIHGLADDNVFAAHTLRLSSALLAAGRTHTVLPLSGVTHMTPQEVVAENLKLQQLQFLKAALG